MCDKSSVEEQNLWLETYANKSLPGVSGWWYSGLLWTWEMTVCGSSGMDLTFGKFGNGNLQTLRPSCVAFIGIFKLSILMVLLVVGE